MGPRLKRNKELLRVIANAASKKQKRILRCVDCDFIDVCRDCCKNILEGRINIPSKAQQKLFRYKTAARTLGRDAQIH